MNAFCRPVLAVTTAVIVLLPSLLSATEPHFELKAALKVGAKPPVEIKIRPCVGHVQDVEGVVNAVGMPIVFVKAGKPAEPWWVQNYPIATGPRQFKVRLIFGNEKTPPGSAFHVVAVMMPNTTRWQDYQVGSQHANLPGSLNFLDLPNTADTQKLPELPQSNWLQVTLLGSYQIPGVEQFPTTKERDSAYKMNQQLPAAKIDVGRASDIISIATPTADSAVLRVTGITGRIAAGYTPVVLIRPLSNEHEWWIQNRPVVMSDQRFRGNLVLGSERTPEGTQFRVVVLAFEDIKAAEKFKAGGSLKELPTGVKKSPEFTVTYRHTRLAEVEAE